MAWTNTTDKNTGYLVTANDYNILQDNLDYLKSNTAQEVFIPPSALYTTNNSQYLGYFYGVLMPATCQGIGYFQFKVPDDFVSFTKIEGIWQSAVVSTSEQMYWGMNAIYAQPNEYITAGTASSNHFDQPGSTYQYVAGKTNTLYVTQPPLPLTLSNLTIGDYVSVQVTRNATEANDDANFMLLLGLLFTYTGRFTST